MTHVLTVPRMAYQSVAATFPIAARTVLENLQTKAEQVVPLRSARQLVAHPWLPCPWCVSGSMQVQGRLCA